MPICKYSLLYLAAATKEQIASVANKLNLTSEEVVNLAAEVDPSKKYEVWLLKQMALGNIKLPENKESVKTTLKNFERLNDNRKLKFTNINQYKKIQDLEEEIKSIKGDLPPEVFDSSVQNLLKYKGVSIFAQDSEWFILRIKTEEPLMEAADSTKWCTRHEQNAETYLRDHGDQFVVYQKEDGRLIKYAQFAEDFAQFQNVENQPINRDIYASLVYLILENMPLTKNLIYFCEATGALSDSEINKLYKKWEAYELKRREDLIANLKKDERISVFVEEHDWIIFLFPEDNKVSYNIRLDISEIMSVPVFSDFLCHYYIFNTKNNSFYAVADEDFQSILDKYKDDIFLLDSDLYSILKKQFPNSWSIMARHPQGFYEFLLNNPVWDGNFNAPGEDFPFELRFPEGFTVTGGLNLYNSYLNFLPENLTVYGSLDASETMLSNFPRHSNIGGSIDIRNTPVTSLPNDLHVKGYLDISYTDIKELPSGLVVEQTLLLHGVDISKLPPDLICNGEIFGLNRTTGEQFYKEYKKIKELRDQVDWLEKKYDK